MSTKGKTFNATSNPAAKAQEKILNQVSPASGSAGRTIGIPNKTVPIEESNWNKTYTYYFAVRDANERTGEVTGRLTALARSKLTDAQAEVPLMIAPQAIAISTSFASTVVATNRGVIEENNGSIFKNIVISGTTGILPSKDILKLTTEPSSAMGKIAKSLFPAGTSAVDSFLKNVKRTVHGAGDLTANASTVTPTHTGYYQFWRLHNFFQEYAALKSKKGFGKIRLLFVSPKDGIAYIVTPQSFDLRRDASAPGEYRYSISLRAWGVVTPNGDSPENIYASEEPNRNRPESVKSVLERLRRARQTIQSASSVIKGVQSDIFDIMNVVNQGILALKDVAGVGNTVLDFLPTIKSNAEHLITTNKNQWRQVLEERRKILAKYEGSSSKADKIGSSSKTSSKDMSPTGETDSSTSVSPDALMAVNMLLDNPEVADDISLRELSPLPQSIANQIQSQVEASQETTATQIIDLTDKLQEVSDNLAYASGLMDPDYAATYGLPAPIEDVRPPNEDDILLAASIEEAKDAFLSTLSSGNVYQELPDNPFDTANGYVSDEEEIPTPTSSYAYMMNRGDTLERIALNLLDDATRAREIAILNQLRAPYIDEEGFTLPISLASGRTFIVNDRSKIVIGQTIRIGGTGTSTIRRKIENIEDIGGSSYKVTVDGRATSLNPYTSGVSPFLHSRLPGTVGSGDTILIPSSDAPDTVQGTRSTPLSDRLSFAEKVFLVDIALDKNGDLDLEPSGDMARSYGYQNAVQALRLLVETEKGELQLHPDFGLDASIGQKFSGELIAELRQRVKGAIMSDPRFADALVSVQHQGTALVIRVDAVGKRGTGRIPVEFRVSI